MRNPQVIGREMMSGVGVDSFGSKGSLVVGDESYEIFRLSSVEGSARLPFSLKVLLENLLRTEDGANITAERSPTPRSSSPRRG
jgi:aconitate hydratase